jgi:hypothetical protein
MCRRDLYSHQLEHIGGEADRHIQPFVTLLLSVNMLRLNYSKGKPAEAGLIHRDIPWLLEVKRCDR